MQCDGSIYQVQTFELILKDNDEVNIHSHYAKSMVSVEAFSGRVKCAKVSPGLNETFKIVDL